MRLLVSIPFVAALAGCAVHATPGAGGPFHYPAGPQAIRVPPGHLPPPGACRVWFPDRPPGQQPPPGDCARLQHQVPPGAVLVRG